MTNIICKICGKECQYLGSHLWHAHKIKAKEYKQKFRLDLNYPLISEIVKKKKQDAYNKDRKKYLTNLNTKQAIKHRFKKGDAIPRTYFSEISKKRTLTNLEKMNNFEKRSGICPICKMQTKHIESHLYNKHGLLIRDKNKFYGKSKT